MPVVESRSDPLHDPDRLATLRRLKLLDTAPEEVFDRFTRLAQEVIGADVALMSLVESDRQFFKSQQGLPEPWAGARQTPLSHSFCQRVVSTGEPLVVTDAREDSRVAGNLAIRDLGVVGYAGVPLTLSEGRTVGALCVVTTEPRTWTERELRILGLLGEAVVREIELRNRVAHRELHDPLTGLAGDGLFAELLQRELGHGGRRPSDLALLAIEIDRFDLVHDAFGTRAGEAILIEVAGRLTATMRTDDVACHSSGPSFLLLCHGARDETTAQQIAERFRRTLCGTPFTVEEETFSLAASIGVALPGHDDASAADLIAAATVDLVRARSASAPASSPSHDGLRRRAASSLRLHSAFVGAVSRGELHLLYQPIIDLRTGSIAGVEALARWTHPELGAVSPAEFIPVAERSGQIIALGEWALAQASRQLAEWRSASATPLKMSVNLAPQQLQQANLADRVADVLEATGIHPASLTLEITERALLDDGPLTQRALETIAATGVSFALDDFGIGYSALSYLHRFPLDALKIDRSFVAAMDQDSRSRRLIEAIIRMAGVLGLSVTAEGIETSAQLDTLTKLGCRYGQGFHLGRPQLAEQISQLLAVPTLTSPGR